MLSAKNFGKFFGVVAFVGTFMVMTSTNVHAINASGANNIVDSSQRPVEANGDITYAKRASCQYGSGPSEAFGHYTGSYISDPDDGGSSFNAIGVGVDEEVLGYTYLGHHCTKNMNGIINNNISPATYKPGAGSLDKVYFTPKSLSATAVKSGSSPQNLSISSAVKDTTFELDWARSVVDGMYYVFSGSTPEDITVSGLSSLEPGIWTIQVTLVEKVVGMGGATRWCVNPDGTDYPADDNEGSNCPNVHRTHQFIYEVESFSVQGVRVFHDNPQSPPATASGQFSTGQGTVTIEGSNTSNNPFTSEEAFTSDVNVGSSSTITRNGKTYELGGYSICFGATNCHSVQWEKNAADKWVVKNQNSNSGPLNTHFRKSSGSSTAISANNAIAAGGYADIYWHYVEVDPASGDKPSGFIDCSTSDFSSITVTPTFSNPNPSKYTNFRIRYRRISPSTSSYTNSGQVTSGSSEKFNGLSSSSTYDFILQYIDPDVSATTYQNLGNITCVTQNEPSSAAICPSMPGPAGSHVRDTLSHSGPGNAGPKTGYSRNKNDSYTEIKRTGIDGDSLTVTDISIGGSKVNLAAPFDFMNATNGQSADVTVDYKPFIEYCPYDRNQAEVRYDSLYEKQEWETDSTPDSYTCDGPGGIKSGTTNKCFHEQSRPGCSTGTYSSSHQECVTSSSGHINSSGNCVSGAADDDEEDCTYYTKHGKPTQCSSPYSFVAESEPDGGDCEYTYDATPLYKWEKDGARTNEIDTTGVKKFKIMEPCFNRLYRSGEGVTTRASFDVDEENPTSSEFTSKARVDFTVADPNSNAVKNQVKNAVWPERIRSTFRVASKVTLPYSLQYRKNNVGTFKAVESENVTITDTSKQVTVNNVDSGVLSNSISVSVAEQNTAAVVDDLYPGDYIRWQIVVGSGSNGVNGEINVDGVTVAADSNTHSSARSTARVENWPYFKVYGNDVASGGGINSCSGTAGMQITFRSGAFGSSVQYAAYVLGDDGGDVGTATLRSGLTGKITTATTASNGTGPIPRGGLMIDNLNSYNQINCMPDYFAWSQDAKPIAKASNTAKTGKNIRQELTTANTNDRNIEYLLLDNADAVMDNGEVVVPDGMRKVIFVDGTLWIDKNIRYSSNSWNNKADVPYVMIVARNIVIGRDVTRLDGMYVAQGDDANSGKIWTCDEYDETENIYDECTKQLVVNGALHATNSVYFMRSFGSLRDGAANEGRSNANPIGSGCGTKSGTNGNPSNAGTFNSSTSCAAEVINFTPEMFLPLTEIVTPEDSFKYDSFSVGAPNL